MDGIKVLDFTRLLPGPLATYILAHLGAEVIKVEDTKTGDMTRYIPPITDGKGAVFSFLNAGKKSLSLDLKTEEGKSVIERIIPKIDVIVEGFRPQVMRKLGLDFESVKKINPKIIYCSISGYGQTGPLSYKSGHDLNYISFSGIQRMFISDEKGIAVLPQIQIADISGALFACIGILDALVERERKKENFEGKFIDISMVETSLFLAVESLSKFLGTVEEPKPFGELLTGGATCYMIYKTKDGKWLSIGALEPKFWENFIKALGLEDEILPSDAVTPPDDSNPAYKKIKEKIMSMTSEEIERIFSKFDIPYEFVQGYKEMKEHEQIKSRKIFYKLKDTELLKLPFMVEVKTPAPELGEHTIEILKEFGFEDKEISELEEKGIIRAIKKR